MPFSQQFWMVLTTVWVWSWTALNNRWNLFGWSWIHHSESYLAPPNHRKATTLFASACRFYRCIQSKQVGLICNAFILTSKTVLIFSEWTERRFHLFHFHWRDQSKRIDGVSGECHVVRSHHSPWRNWFVHWMRHFHCWWPHFEYCCPIWFIAVAIFSVYCCCLFKALSTSIPSCWSWLDMLPNSWIEPWTWPTNWRISASTVLNALRYLFL